MMPQDLNRFRIEIHESSRFSPKFISNFSPRTELK